MVGCDRSTLASMSQAHMPTDFSIEQQPFSFSRERMRRRVGSAIAERTVFNSVAIGSHQCTDYIDGCQYKISRGSAGRALGRILSKGAYVRRQRTKATRTRDEGSGTASPRPGPHAEVAGAALRLSPAARSCHLGVPRLRARGSSTQADLGRLQSPAPVDSHPRLPLCDSLEPL